MSDEISDPFELSPPVPVTAEEERLQLASVGGDVHMLLTPMQLDDIAAQQRSHTNVKIPEEELLAELTSMNLAISAQINMGTDISAILQSYPGREDIAKSIVQEQLQAPNADIAELEAKRQAIRESEQQEALRIAEEERRAAELEREQSAGGIGFSLGSLVSLGGFNGDIMPAPTGIPDLSDKSAGMGLGGFRNN